MPQQALGIFVHRVLRIAGFAFVSMAAMAGAANAANRVGWVWGNKPGSAIPYVPAVPESFNSVGGTILIRPISVGVYQVEFGNLFDGTPDDVQITAYAGSGYCTSGGWSGSKTTVLALVNCYDAAGNPANRAFTLLYQSRSAPFGTPNRGLAFLWADQPSNPGYTPALTRQYNSAGGINTIVRVGLGNYNVFLPKLTKIGGDVQVTAYSNQGPAGGNVPARCKVGSWGSNADGTSVNVLCFDSLGRPADELFDLAYALGATFGLTGSATLRGTYAWADQPAIPGPYVTDPVHQFNGFATGPLTSQRTGIGLYTITIPGTLTYTRSNVLVTSYGNTNFYCNVVKWVAETINVGCHKQGGGPIDSQFDVGFQTSN